MKTRLYLFILLAVNSFTGISQITTPVIRANFGVDADLRSNFFNNLVQSGNDDWFKFPGSVGTGQFIIDTTGATAMIANYTADPNSRKLPFFRNMRFSPYTVINNRLLVDAYFVRDYHGDDSTIFAAGSNKNGMSPADWSCPVSQSIPDKNEILDIMMHVRRAGPNTTDSLWLMGGISIENTTGNRYFDFEMYQTDIYYDRATRQFYNYGPDAGHTRWQFDAGGNMKFPGDIILTAEYSSSALTNVEARIWIDRNDLLITPAGFNWTGSFDGAGSGSQYGYAGITPKTAGAFYTGLQSVSNTWAGAFGLVLGDNSLLVNYAARQYMEYSVNLSKLGLDQAQIFGGDDCQMPFRRVIVKTRASTSFTSELKDFVAPFDFFIAPKAEVETTSPVICDTGSISHVYVLNPIATSVYEWYTPNGNIITSPTGPSIYVDTPGVYIVRQYLQAGCSLYATDTITIAPLDFCGLLANNSFSFRGEKNNDLIRLTLNISENQLTGYYDIERSTDGTNFQVIQTNTVSPKTGWMSYPIMDNISGIAAPYVYYRARLHQFNSKQLVSPVIKFATSTVNNHFVTITPNPVKDNMQISIFSGIPAHATIYLYDQMGKIIDRAYLAVQKGNNMITLGLLSNKPAGIYQAIVTVDDKVYTQRLVHIK
jgi:hypothetical protein